jgi:hypothetical protein
LLLHLSSLHLFAIHLHKFFTLLLISLNNENCICLSKI